MKISRLFLAVALSTFGLPAFGQTIPNVPDVARDVTYNVTSSTQNFDIPFPVYGDCTDIQVRLNGTLQLGSSFTCISKSGTPFANVARPVTDAQVQLVNPVTSSTVEVSGAWHPRWSMGSSAGITRSEFNRDLGTALSGQREIFDYLQGIPPGAVLAVNGKTGNVNLSLNDFAYTPGIAGGATRSFQSTLDNMPIAATAFGAVGDGNIANAAANVAAITAINAAGRCASLPYTAAGYNFGTLSATIGTGACVLGENLVHVQYSGTSAPFKVTAHEVISAPARIENITIDMASATSSATGIRNMTVTNGNVSVAGVRIRHVMCLNAYECIGDEADPYPAWTSGTSYPVGTIVMATSTSFRVTTKGPGNSTFLPGTSSAGTTLGDGYVWAINANTNFTTDEEWDDVQALLTKGRQFYLRHTRGFIYPHNIRCDQSQGGQTNPSWTCLQFDDFIGLEFGRVDCVGNPSLAGFAYNAGSYCLTLNGNTINNPGFASVWVLDRILADSTNGGGFNFNNVAFLDGPGLLQGEFNYGNGFIGSNVQTANLQLKMFGITGTAGAAANANGFSCTGCDRLNISSATIDGFTGNAFVAVNTTNVNVPMFLAKNNAGNIWAFSGTSGNLKFTGGAVANNGAGLADTSSGGGNDIRNVSGYNTVGVLSETSAPNLQLGPSNWNHGTSASSTTFARGDGTWAAPVAGAGGTSGQVQYNNAGALGGFTMSGDVTVNTATGAAALASVLTAAGPIGSTTTVPVITYDAKGRLTVVTSATIASSTVNGTACAPGGSCTVTAVPSGTAGGDLSGSYPNPTVAKINGVAVPAGPYAIGDLLYAGTTTSLSRLADVATAKVLRSGGVGVAPAWGSINLSTDLDANTLPTANSAALAGDVTKTAGTNNTVLATAQPAVHTWALTQTFTVAPAFTDQSGTRTALGLATVAASGSASDLSTGTLSGALLPAPTASVFGGIKAWTCATHQFPLSIALGVVTCGQPAAADISGLATIATSGSASDLSAGTVAAARMPALTGSCTTTVGTVATTCEQDGAWTAYAPTLSCGNAGSLTSASGAGAWKLIGTKTLALRLRITVTTVGTCATSLIFTFPNSSTAAGPGIIAGKDEAGGVGIVMAGFSASAGSTGIQSYNNGFPAVNGSLLDLSGVMEIQ